MRRFERWQASVLTAVVAIAAVTLLDVIVDLDWLLAALLVGVFVGAFAPLLERPTDS
jgi:hypothetical protein